MSHSLECVLTTLFLALHGQPSLSADDPIRTYTPQELRDDLTAIESAIARIHPNLEHSVSRSDYTRALASVRSELDHAMSAEKSWTVFCKLNSVLADGHLVA